MSLESQIQLITVPQEFSRLCNAVLDAECGSDFLPIDDDQGDRGNDGYLKSEKRMFAAHCFKRVQNQSIEAAIRTKMVGDLGKAIALAQETDDWDIEAWTFLSNYPVSEAVGNTLRAMGSKAGIDVSWRGADYLAGCLQRHEHIRALFPSLQVNEVGERLAHLEQAVNAASEADEEQGEPEVVTRSPRTPQEESALLRLKQPGWEYLLFAGALWQGRDALKNKWHDRELGVGRGAAQALDVGGASAKLQTIFGPCKAAVGRLGAVLDPAAQERAFGKPGEPGDEDRIKHLASHLVASAEELLDIQAEVRSYTPPEAFEEVFELAARLPDAPLGQVYDFIGHLVERIDEIPAHLALPEDQRGELVVELTLVIEIEDGLPEGFSAAVEKLERRLLLDGLDQF